MCQRPGDYPLSLTQTFKDCAASLGLYRLLLPLSRHSVLAESIVTVLKDYPPSEAELKDLSDSALAHATAAHVHIDRHFYVNLAPNDSNLASAFTDLFLSLESNDPTLLAVLRHLAVLVRDIPPEQLAAVGSRSSTPLKIASRRPLFSWRLPNAMRKRWTLLRRRILLSE
jgi:hypothetical protein